MILTLLVCIIAAGECDWVADPPAIDWNQDGGVDGSDVEAFVRDWQDGLTDINTDGCVDLCDLVIWLDFWAIGG